jgi:uncharacterized protein (TIGR02466 family)
MIFQYEVENSEQLNKTLLDLTYAERDTGIAVNKSNTPALGTWRSATGLHKKPAYEPILTEVNSALSGMSEDLNYATDQMLKVSSMWSIINPPGNGNRARVHPGGLWSGLYFVQASDKGGNIEFIDPRTVFIMSPPKYRDQNKRPRESRTKITYKPIAGRMLIFPSWLYHGVDPNLSENCGRAGDSVIMSFKTNQVRK